ncbi:hypothetical protein, partial [Stappia indica]|uniref:hypothetical protein n=1 Tax=Stappia indica TaxID=538381 RepID=UPI001CD72543
RREGGEGWHIEETWADLDTFKANRGNIGMPCAEVRFVGTVARRDEIKPGKGWLSADGHRAVISRGWTWDEDAECWWPLERMARMLPSVLVAVDDVEVTFDIALTGWQPVQIATGGRATTFNASAVFDPFPDILKWLEVIAAGGEGKVLADLEGFYLELFAFNTSDPARIRLVVAEEPGRDEETRDIELDIDVDRRKFVSRFYQAFRAYACSDDYVIDEWAGLSMREDLVRKEFPGKPELMTGVDAGVLNDLLLKMYPDYVLAVPSAKNREEKINILSDYIYSGRRDRRVAAKPVPRFVVPPEFDGWDTEQRATYVKDLLAQVVTPFSGSNLASLRSLAVEAFLGSLPGK